MILNQLSSFGQIASWLATQPVGTLFTPVDIPLQILPKTLSNELVLAVRNGYLRRIAPGIFQNPKYDSVLGDLEPSLEDVAVVIARRDGARIVPSGGLALNRLGLSTQVPMRPVYLTDGSARVVRVGNQEIRFRPASLRVLSIKGLWSQMVVLALKELGKSAVADKATRNTLVQALTRESRDTLLHDAAFVPAWLRPIFHEAIKQK